MFLIFIVRVKTVSQPNPASYDVQGNIATGISQLLEYDTFTPEINPDAAQATSVEPDRR